jgi:osmotically-inducible protein OsmY
MVRDAVAYLGGRIDRMGAKAVAEGLVWESGAVCDVRNLICHGPACTMTDREIAEGIRTLIAEHPELRREGNLGVAVEGSVVVLSGELRDPAHRELVCSLCWFVPGVREVEDRLGPV